jgi:hypothetical protein
MDITPTVRQTQAAILLAAGAGLLRGSVLVAASALIASAGGAVTMVA